MVSTRFACFALCLALLPWSQKGGQDRGKPKWPWNPQTQTERLMRDALGFWELVRLDADNKAYLDSDLKGYLLIAPEYLAFEYHFGGPAYDVREVEEYAHQSGIQRYKFDGLGRMETINMIGSDNLAEDGDLTFEPPGRKRIFMVELEGDRLILSHTFSRFEFHRIGESPYPDLEEGVNFDERLRARREAEEEEQGE
jgi:hypothetical protein